MLIINCTRCAGRGGGGRGVGFESALIVRVVKAIIVVFFRSCRINGDDKWRTSAISRESFGKSRYPGEKEDRKEHYGPRTICQGQMKPIMRRYYS